MAAFLDAALPGLLTGLSLIVAIGAQNAYLLRVGISAPKRVVLAASAICALSDFVLIAAGVGGLGVLVERFPRAVWAVTVFGVVFLVAYGLAALRRVALPESMQAGPDGADGGYRLSRVVPAMLAFTWLNPHVYLDTVLLLGSIANAQAHPWWWASGAMFASLAWFFGLGFGARLLRPIFALPRAWQVLDFLIALTMFAIAAKLAAGLF